MNAKPLWLPLIKLKFHKYQYNALGEYRVLFKKRIILAIGFFDWLLYFATISNQIPIQVLILLL